MSKELENSLQQAVETYFNERLRAIDEQVSRLQAEFNDAFTRLRESSASESLDATSLASSIAAHLQAAREQKLSGGVTSAPAQTAGEAAMIKRAVAEFEKQQTQAEVLSALLKSAAQFAERVALFVIKNQQAIGWRVCEASDPSTLESISGVALSLTAETLVSRAARSRSTWNGAPGSNSGDRSLIDQLGGEPQSLVAIPLVVRAKVVAVLYADSAATDPNAVNLDALEVLARVAGMAVDLVSGTRATQPSQVSEPTTAAPPALVEPETEVHEDIQPVAPEPSAEPAYTPWIEPQTTPVFAEPVVEAVSGESPAEVVSEKAAEPAVEEVSAATETVVEEAAKPIPESVSTSTAIESAPAPPSISPPPAPGFASQYAAPLGSARRYGVTEPDLPIEVGEDERRLHNDARRFARLLVSEIKLYNEPKVKEGRSRGDLYDRLREDIDRSRQMYDKRVAPPVAARHDYFHQELVNTLAEGDPAKLGTTYPGAGAHP